jgi:hypothetical protein
MLLFGARCLFIITQNPTHTYIYIHLQEFLWRSDKTECEEIKGHPLVRLQPIRGCPHLHAVVYTGVISGQSSQWEAFFLARGCHIYRINIPFYD